ncbi:PhzF family phenazine biosynthesis protein [Sphingomonas sp. TDK1]|uniref:PhzF family phenazine biosynthesis protein n=1 Tax=Sphingomonas sp. TDK1 TaxID=453247 RepID=UPI0007D9A20D|nr:PhzF family phenazine biosynthesis protein [Sphingomonas sp. TDK1]OAN65616.1 phenazine biosynthesis protein PhzF [Sphingomonas sp. TDK1]
MTTPFSLVDVFHDGPFTGNPLAVVHGGGDLDTATMLAITRWFNLSETVFLLPPSIAGADYHARIFTLDRELPFAGHPTLGACHAWLAAGGVPAAGDRIVQQCGAGLIPIRRNADRLAFAAPPLMRDGPVDSDTRAMLARALRIDPDAIVDAAWADNGPGWIAVLLHSAEAVLAVEPVRHWDGRVEIGLIGAHPAGGPVDWEIRTFFSGAFGAVIEDPVTGSFNASAAQWLLESGRATGGYVAAQGTRLDRRGRIFVTYEADGQAWIGGRSMTIAKGVLPGLSAPA